MPLFEVQAEVDGKYVAHVAEYESADAAKVASLPHLGPNDRILDVIAYQPGMLADTRRLAAAMLGQTADDGFKLL